MREPGTLEDRTRDVQVHGFISGSVHNKSSFLAQPHTTAASRTCRKPPASSPTASRCRFCMVTVSA